MIKNFFHIENLFKNWKNKGYCIQLGLNEGFNFLYQIFNFEIKLLDDTHYFGIYFTLFGSLLSFDVSLTRKCDHAGFEFNFNLLWLLVHITIYDTRHWDYENEDWYKYD